MRIIADCVTSLDTIANTINIDSLSGEREPTVAILGFAHQDMQGFKVRSILFFAVFIALLAQRSALLRASRVRLSVAIYAQLLLFLLPKHAREGLAQPQAWSKGDMSAEHSLQCEVGKLAGVTRLRQVRPSRACAFSARQSCCAPFCSM